MAAVCSNPINIVFPPPPPTTNSLTSQQRKQLLRTTKKLSHLLGYTPHLIDTSDVHLGGPVLVNLNHRDPLSSPRSSLESVASLSSSQDNHNAPLERILSLSVRGSARSSPSSSPTSSDSCSLSTPLDSINSSPNRRPPILKLTRTNASAPDQGIPSPTSSSPSSPSSTSSGYYSPVPDNRYTLRIRPHPFNNTSPRNSLDLRPSFTIPSDNALRRQKMERLRRKLGDNVPVELVFPSTSSEEDSDSDAQSRWFPNEDSELLPSPTPRPMSMARTQAKLMKARDSLRLSAQCAKRRSEIPIIASQPASRPPVALCPIPASKANSLENCNPPASKQGKRRSNLFQGSILKVKEVVQEDKIVVQVTVKEVVKGSGRPRKLGRIEESPEDSWPCKADKECSWEWDSEEGADSWDNVARLLAPRQSVRFEEGLGAPGRGLKRSSWRS